MAFVKRNAFVMVALALFLISLVSYGVTLSSHENKIEAQTAEISELEREVTHVGTKVEAEREAAGDRLTGTQTERRKADTVAINKMLNTALTWSDHASYTKARDVLLGEYGVSADSSFMKTFLPPAPVNKDSSGKSYYYIDAAKLNSTLGSIQTKVLSVQGTKYNYMISATVQAKSTDQKGTASNWNTVFLSIDGQGKISDISGYASGSKERTSKSPKEVSISGKA